MSDCAPVLLFVFNRPDHTNATLNALRGNALAEKSELFVYSDGSRTDADISKVNEVRALVRSTSGFRSVTLIERDSNLGLARNIIDGVTDACGHYGRVIVLEDDIVTAPSFLEFMNRALDRYADDPKVWHISGWNYPIDDSGLGEVFFWRLMNCWGWGTWANRWQYFQKNPQRLVDAWGTEKIHRFNLDGAHDFWSQVTANCAGRINTWAIFWYATIFEKGGLCLNPTRTQVVNVGHDGTGQNCGKTDVFLAKPVAQNITALPAACSESELAVTRVSAFYRMLVIKQRAERVLRIPYVLFDRIRDTLVRIKGLIRWE